MNIEEMRQYIRHPTDIPIECSVPDTPIEDKPRMRNVSKSGLCFATKTRIEPGSNIHLKIPLNGVELEVDGLVMWCHDMDRSYEMGVKFNDDETGYSVRMIEQLCHIEQYRQQVQENEGREISSEEAGKEWVTKFASDFPE
jgi:Tfp pilus assembly protein PilZ